MNEVSVKVKPLSIWWSLMIVLLPAGTAAWLIHFILPSIIRTYGVPFLYVYLPWWIGLMPFYFVGSIVAHRLEGNPSTLKRFVKRYRLKRIQGKDWFWLRHSY